ncbi:MAG: hybrid sensor histidine kinase/response regulator [Pseudomonadota bacterium]
MDKNTLVRRLLKTFLGELEEHVQALDRNLLILERESDMSVRMEVFKNLFRTGHSLKGAARSVNVDVLETVGHHLESIFAAARDGAINIDAKLFELLFATADAIKDMGQRLGGGKDVSKSPLMALLPRLQAACASPVPASQPSDVALVTTAGESIAAPPSVGGAPISEAAEISTREAREAFVRIPSARLNRLITLGGELRVARSRTADRDADLEHLIDMLKRWQSEWQAVEKSMRGSWRHNGHGDISSGTPQASLSVMRMLEQGKENLLWLMRQTEHLAADFAADRKALDQVAAPLEREVMRARMVPFAEACEGLDRAARDLAKETGKEVDLAVEGGEIEIDRSVVAAIKDALLHLVRNAVDHGIEPPAARVVAGKAARGQITLTAALRQGRVEITVADDGRGFDIEAIRAQAQKRGLPLPEDDRAIARLAFTHGFTTSPILTEISGRGVGLDVVKTAAESQRGSYDVVFEPRRGSRVVLTVPLTLTRLPALLVRAEGQTYAFDSAAVRGLRRVEVGDLRTIEGRDVLVFDGAPVPVFRLADILGQQTHEAAYVDGKALVVVLGVDAKHAAFTVDELLAEQEVVVKDLGPRLQHVNNIAGATILPTGRIALILNAADLLHTALGHMATHALSDALASRPFEAKKRLLVVDDSVTTRTLMKSILEAAGYEVLDASDGMGAWQLLQEKGADLVVTDVEMPRMDGFGLTEAIRNSKRLQNLPVILVTAMETEQDKMRGLDAGADAYLLKSAFDQTKLIQAIEELI